MANYPSADTETGFVYDQDRDLPMVPVNNARATGYFTVALATSTTVEASEIRKGDIVILTPKNAKASNIMQGASNVTSGIYVSAVADESFTVTHDNHASAAGAIFNYAVFRVL
jgi:hypothetical protein